ncbi:MAG TPA: LamG-like jellyroll fold domain-containing protein, partial [Candidatus Saccharimonadales bacterium]|nr:LamG-like jellyroll fold domain-containing protein [Candidatus Saccharimonadales bacterium]
MKIKLRLLFIILAVIAVVHSALAQSPIITSFSENGVLECTNLNPGSAATVEWASSLSGPWYTNWSALNDVTPNSNDSIQVSVPMFYRVVEVTNTFPTSGLVLFSKFGEGSGNTTADSSGNGHTGYLTNSPLWIVGVSDDALSFNSNLQQSAGFGNLYLAGSNQCTFSMWMKKTQPANIGLAALGCTSGTYNAIFLAWWNDGNVYGGVGFTNAGRVFVAPYVANTWVHFAMVYDGTQLQNSNRINIYINGVPATPSTNQSWAKTAISTSIGTVSTNFSL